MIEISKSLEETNDVGRIGPSLIVENDQQTSSSQGNVNSSSSPSSNSRLCHYSRYLRDKIMEINPHRVPCSFKEVLEEKAQETLRVISDAECSHVMTNQMDIDRGGGVGGIGRDSTMSDTDVASRLNLPLWFASDPDVKSRDVGATLRRRSGPFGSEEFEPEEENNQSTTHSPAGLKPCVSLDDLIYCRSSAKSCDEACVVVTLADDRDDNDADADAAFCPPSNHRSCQEAWKDTEESMTEKPEKKSEPLVLIDMIHDEMRLSLSHNSERDEEVTGWSVCPHCRPGVTGVGTRHATSPRRRATSSRQGGSSAPSKSTTPLPGKSVITRRSGSSENINTIAKYLSWKPSVSLASKTRNKSNLAKTTPTKPKAKSKIRDPGVILSPRKPEIKYQFHHDKSHRNYMRTYRTTYTNRHLYPSFGLSLNTLNTLERDVPVSKVQISCKEIKDGSTIKVSQFKFKMASTLRTNNQIHARALSNNSKVGTPPPSPILSPIVCRSRPSIPSNARGVVCPTSVETPSHVVTANRDRATLERTVHGPDRILSGKQRNEKKNKTDDLTQHTTNIKL